MLSSRAEHQNHVVVPTTLKTPGTKRRAFGDISNRKPAATTIKNNNKAASIIPISKPQQQTIAKPTIVVKEKTQVSFIDDDDDSIEKPAGRMGKDLGTDEWLLGDDFFDEIERQDKEFDDAILLAHESSKKAELERHEQYKKDLELECRNDGIADGTIQFDCLFASLTHSNTCFLVCLYFIYSIDPWKGIRSLSFQQSLWRVLRRKWRLVWWIRMARGWDLDLSSSSHRNTDCNIRYNIYKCSTKNLSSSISLYLDCVWVRRMESFLVDESCTRHGSLMQANDHQDSQLYFRRAEVDQSIALHILQEHNPMFYAFCSGAKGSKCK